MNLKEWAKKEIVIAREKAEKDGEGFDEYIEGCYNSALKAFESLIEDGHSGMSVGITQQILNRLIETKPLTPIEDSGDIWNDISSYQKLREGVCVQYQCKRMPSLFKEICVDGTINYSDCDLFHCVDINKPNCTYNSGLVYKVLKDIFPITMPYYPGPPIRVFCEDFLTDKKNGDFDTVGIFHAIKPDGEKISINKYFKGTDDGWDEIDLTEYVERKTCKIK